MKKNELLEKLKQGNFDLTETITTTQFKDIEVARWFFKNVVEDGELMLFKNIILNNTYCTNKNFVEFNNIYRLIDVDLCSYNYHVMRILSLYINNENKSFLLSMLDYMEDFKRDNNIKIMDNLFNYIIDNNIHGEINQYIYNFFMGYNNYVNTFRDYIIHFTKLLTSRDCDVINPYMLDTYYSYKFFNDHKKLFSKEELNRLNNIIDGWFCIEV